MNTCGTCKYFGEPEEVSTWHTDYLGETTETVGRYHLCGLLQHLNGSSKRHENIGQEVAGVIDGSGYYATFCVTEDFGCNQWAATAAVNPEEK